MPLDVTVKEVQQSICPDGPLIGNWPNQFYEATTPPFAPIKCFNTTLPGTETLPIESQITLANRNCPYQSSFPVVGGQSVVFTSTEAPFRVALDERAAYQIAELYDFPEAGLQRNCNLLLNGFYPGCSKTSGAGACDWKDVIVGKDVGGGNVFNAYKSYESCGGYIALLEKGGIVDQGASKGYKEDDVTWCNVAASFCLRLAFDQTYKASCCKQTLVQDFSLSDAVWTTNTFFAEPSMRLADLNPNTPAFALPLSSNSYNPYQLFCDPQWCPNGPACDTIFYESCLWSTTTIGTSTVHACVAPSGQCRDWYSASTLSPTPGTALTLGNHNWLLIDTLIKNYCLSSASALGDTTSCACVGTANRSIENPGSIVYYTSCSSIGIGTNCPESVVPVAPIDGFPQPATLTGTPRILTDPVCSNIDCLASRLDGTRFLTSGALQRALACPQHVCLLAVMNSTFSFANIGTGTRFIGELSQFCVNQSFSVDAPTFRVIEAPTLWFWSNVGQSITNPNLTSILRIENVSANPDTNMNWSISWNGAPTGGLPPWLEFQGTTSGQGVFAGNAATVQFTLGEVTKAPLYHDLDLNVFMIGQGGITLSQQSVTLNFAVIDIDKPNTPLPSGDDTDPNGVPLRVQEQLSPGGWALLALSVLLLVIAFFAFVQGIRTSTLLKKAKFWSSAGYE